MTQRELEIVGRWDNRRLWFFCYNWTKRIGHRESVKFLMEFRRDLQYATSIYSKYHEFDDLQKNVIGMSEKILKWCRQWYMPWAQTEVIRMSPELAGNPDSVKYRTRDMWEKFVRRFSY